MTSRLSSPKSMYAEYFGLSEEPFSVAANPRFLFMSLRHREALAHLLYGIRSDSGFVLLTGEVGTGKTTVCRCLLEQLPDTTDVAFILNPKVTVMELLSTACDELGIEYRPHNRSIKVFVDAINRHLLATHAKGRNTVLIIDEAQNLRAGVLEQLRLLTNLETNERKLLQIILLGQPELDAMLARPELRQLNQRITARYYLRPLLRAELGAYVQHRLAVAGGHEPLFPPRLLGKLYRRTGGIPRLVNVICDRAMLGAYVRSRRKVNGPILEQAAQEVQGRTGAPQRVLPWVLASTAVLLGAAATAAVFYANDLQLPGLQVVHTPAEPAASEPEPPPPLVAAVVSDATPNEPPAPTTWPMHTKVSAESTADAYAALFARWEITARSANRSIACVRAGQHGLRCYSASANLGRLRSLNRPAVLTLADRVGKEYHAALTALAEDTAVLVIAGVTRKVTITDLERHWRGRFTLLWRASPKGKAVIRPGSSGPDVEWLTRRLASIGGSDPALDARADFDTHLEERVKVFQRSRGLTADGIAGRQTLIHINSATDETVPRLDDPRGTG